MPGTSTLDWHWLFALKVSGPGGCQSCAALALPLRRCARGEPQGWGKSGWGSRWPALPMAALLSTCCHPFCLGLGSPSQLLHCHPLAPQACWSFCCTSPRCPVFRVDWPSSMQLVNHAPSSSACVPLSLLLALLGTGSFPSHSSIPCWNGSRRTGPLWGCSVPGLSPPPAAPGCSGHSERGLLCALASMCCWMCPAVDCVPSLSPEGCTRELGIDLPHPSRWAPRAEMGDMADVADVADVTHDPPALPGCSGCS